MTQDYCQNEGCGMPHLHCECGLKGKQFKSKIIMKTHLSENEVLDIAFSKLNIANPNVDKIQEIAELLDLEFDEEKQLYHNPNCCGCQKELSKIDLDFGKKSHPLLCVTCFTSNA